MKLKDLFEAPPPEFRDMVRDQSDWIGIVDMGQPGTYISLTTVTRLFKQIGAVNIQDEQFKILLHNKGLLAGAYLPSSIKQNGEAVYAIACIVYFKSPLINTLPDNHHCKILQIDRVATVPRFESQGLASSVYAALINSGYTVVSDNIQYLGGKLLWKRIARESGSYDVHIYDRDNEDYLRDDNGEPIKYDASNINDDVIWKKGKPGRRFILLAKDTT